MCQALYIKEVSQWNNRQLWYSWQDGGTWYYWCRNDHWGTQNRCYKDS